MNRKEGTTVRDTVTAEQFLDVLESLHNANALDVDYLLNEGRNDLGKTAEWYGLPRWVAFKALGFSCDPDERHAREWLAWIDSREAKA